MRVGLAPWWARSALVVLACGGLVVFAGNPSWSNESAVAGRPVASTALNVRPTPSTKVGAVGQLQARQSIQVVCQVEGQWIADSAAGSSATWDRLASGRYVSDVYVRWRDGRPAVPWCAEAASTDPATPQERFIAWAATFAVPMQAAYQVPAAVTIAQAILESGWGRSGLTTEANNFFGMKCFGGPGPLASGCRSYGTNECDGGSCYATRASFRVYDTVSASFEDHSRALASLPRYQSAFDHTDDPDRFADAVAAAGYATSPSYAQDLISIMRRYGLYRFSVTV
jgi:hypothetical protein